MCVWECDLQDIQAYAKYNHNHRYVLSFKDLMSKFLHMNFVKTKSEPSVASAFRSIFDDTKYSSRRPVCLRTDKDKEFLNKYFQDFLRSEGIQFQVCRNPDLKCAIVELAHRTVGDTIYKYFTFKNTYRYIDVLPKFLRAYNNTVHSTTGMAPLQVTVSYFLAIWRRM